MLGQPVLHSTNMAPVAVTLESDLAKLPCQTYQNGTTCFANDSQTLFVWDSVSAAGTVAGVSVAVATGGAWLAVTAGGGISALDINSVIGAGLSLKNTIPTAAISANVKGFRTPGDNGGGPFYWDPTNVAAAIDGIIVRPTLAVVGAWVRIFDGIPTVVQMGADSTGVLDCTTAFNAAALNFSEFVIPPGNYRLPTGLTTQAEGRTYHISLNALIHLGDTFHIDHSSTNLIASGTPFSDIIAQLRPNFVWEGGANKVMIDFANGGSANNCRLEGIFLDTGTGIANQITGFALGKGGVGCSGHVWYCCGTLNAWRGMNVRSNAQQNFWHNQYHFHLDGLFSDQPAVLFGTEATHVGGITFSAFTSGSIGGFQGGFLLGGGNNAGVDSITIGGDGIDIEGFNPVGGAYAVKLEIASDIEIKTLRTEGVDPADFTSAGIILGSTTVNHKAGRVTIHNNSLSSFRYGIEAVCFEGVNVHSNVIECMVSDAAHPTAGWHLTAGGSARLNAKWGHQRRVVNGPFFAGDVPDRTGFLYVTPEDADANGKFLPSYWGSTTTGSVCDLEISQIRPSFALGTIAIGTTAIAITGISNTTPQVVTTAVPHNYRTNDTAVILGNAAANGTWIITRLTDTTFSLNGSVAAGAIAGGTVKIIGVLNTNAASQINLNAGSFFQYLGGRLVGVPTWGLGESPGAAQDDAATFCRDFTMLAQNAVVGNNHGGNWIFATGSGNGTQAPGTFQIFLGQIGKGNGQIQGVIASCNAALSQQVWDWGGIVSSLQCSGTRFIINNSGGGALELDSGGFVGLKIDASSKIGFYQHATIAQQLLTNNSGVAPTTTIVDVTTAGLADPAKVNANFSSILDALQQLGLVRNV